MQNVDYGKIIKRSWELTWKNKWLWVMGLVLAAFGGGSSGSGGGSGSSSSSNLNIPSASPSPIPSSAPTSMENIRNQTTYVLGEATNFLKSWFTNISVGNWILLGLLILTFVIFTTVTIWILTSWAKGALITGLNIADMEGVPDLKNTSPNGISKIKDLIIFRLISFGLTIAMIFAVAVIIGIGFLVKLFVPVLGIIWLVLFGIIGTLFFIVAMILFTMLTIYAERLIVLKNFSAWEAWKKGLSIGKNNFISTAVMGLINSSIGCASGCVGLLALLLIFAFPGYLLIYPMFKGGFHFPGIGQIIGIVVLISIFISINLLIKAVFIVFDTSNWNLLFKEIYKEGKNE